MAQVQAAMRLPAAAAAKFFADGSSVSRNRKGGRRVRPAMPTGARRAARAKAKKRTRARRWK